MLSLNLLLLSSCFSRKVQVQVAPVDRKPIDLPAIPPLQLDGMRWQIVTESNFQEQMKKIKDSGLQPVFFALDEKGYEALSINMTKIRGYVSQQKSVIFALKSYYGVPDNPESLTPPASIIAQMQAAQTNTPVTKPAETPVAKPAETPASAPTAAPPANPISNNTQPAAGAKKRLAKLIPQYVKK